MGKRSAKLYPFRVKPYLAHPICLGLGREASRTPKSYSTYPPTDQYELFYTDAAKRAALDYKKEIVMGPQIDRLSSRLPRRFPIGAKYVVEGYGGEKGNLRVIARYVVLPGGRRINVPASLSQPASPAGPPHSGPILSDPRMAHHVR
jgi:hypothetical protein